MNLLALGAQKAAPSCLYLIMADDQMDTYRTTAQLAIYDRSVFQHANCDSEYQKKKTLLVGVDNAC